ncbi:MAG: biotin-dependent carboxyltransferase family protein [Bacteroidota bacterium]
MRKARVEVLHPGMLTLVVDQGRQHHAAYGVPVGGALDARSARMAHALVGNSPHSPLLEITWIGPRLLFRQEVCVALTGADLSAKLDHNCFPMNRRVQVPAGSVLTFGRAKQGVRAYLAIGGTWNIPSWLGSATALPSELEYILPQSRLNKGDVLMIGPSDGNSAWPMVPEDKFRPQIEVVIHPGPEFQLFTRESLARFFSHPYQLRPESNRMGFRLKGSPLQLEKPTELISSGVMPGVIQVSHDGQPIILMADAQTSGGYPRMGVVSNEGMQQVAQWQPGTHKRFVLATKR